MKKRDLGRTEQQFHFRGAYFMLMDTMKEIDTEKTVRIEGLDAKEFA